MEKYARRSEIRRIRMGLVTAIFAVAMHEENNPNFSEYDAPAKQTLDELMNPESPISHIMPKTLSACKDSITKALETYPKIEALGYLNTILSVISGH